MRSCWESHSACLTRHQARRQAAPKRRPPSALVRSTLPGSRPITTSTWMDPCFRPARPTAWPTLATSPARRRMARATPPPPRRSSGSCSAQGRCRCCWAATTRCRSPCCAPTPTTGRSRWSRSMPTWTSATSGPACATATRPPCDGPPRWGTSSASCRSACVAWAARGPPTWPTPGRRATCWSPPASSTNVACRGCWSSCPRTHRCWSASTSTGWIPPSRPR